MAAKMTVEVKGANLVITIPMAKDPQPSASGKTLVVCSTRGNCETEVLVQGKPLTIGLNAYIFADDTPKGKAK